jgi:hypothetical protein
MTGAQTSSTSANNPGNMAMANMFGQFAGSVFNSIASYKNTRAQGYYVQADAYNQIMPQYQQIGTQTRQLQAQQAIAFANSNIDLSQGSAQSMLQKTGQNGIEKMYEVQDNLNAYIRNQKRVSLNQANTALLSGLSQGAVGLGKGMYNLELTKLEQQKGKSNLSGGAENIFAE